MKNLNSSRRSFMYGSAMLVADAVTSQQTSSLAHANFLTKGEHYHSIVEGLPARPVENSLSWSSIADSFNAYIMDPRNKVLPQRSDGKPGFVSALEGTKDGGLTTFAPILLGRFFAMTMLRT